MKLFNRGMTALTQAYERTLGVAVRLALPTVILFLAALGGAFWLYGHVPRGFIPEEDAGDLIIAIQAPQGASLAYTTNIAGQAEAVLGKIPEIDGAFTAAGFSFSGGAPNAAMIFASLAPFDRRPGEEHSAEAIVNRMRGPLSGITGAVIVPFSPPAVQGLGNFGGFQFIVEDLGGNTLQALSQATQAVVRAGNTSKDVTGLFTSYTANDPQYVVTFDRDKAKALQVPLNQITDALQVYMGSVYVNDFDFNNRAYRVYVQADRQFRAEPRDIKEYYVRSDKGLMVPLENLVKLQSQASPQVISHYNLFRYAEIDGSAAPGKSSGDAIATMDALANKVLPPGFSYEWTGLSLEEIQSGSQATMLFGLGLLVVYLTLAAQYESFTLPFIVLLAVPMALLGAIGAQALRGQENDVYCQIGLVMLIGLSSKNAILIVEFAEQLREKGFSILDAAVESALIRLRPILMTSLAFILGVLPLVLAQGAGRISRRSVGTTVFGGMIAATFLNLVFIPVLYVLVRRIQSGFKKEAPSASHPPSPSPST